FAEANARPATPAERKLLSGLAERFSAIADEHRAGAPSTGWALVAAAIYEAVEAGSAFVAPRRLREILLRWERDGYPQDTDVGAADAVIAAAPARQTRQPGGATTADPRARLDVGPDIPLPHGQGSRRTWEHVVSGLAGAIEPALLAELVAGTSIVAYHDGEVQLAVPNPARAEHLATSYRDLIERRLSAAMRRPIRLAVITPDDERSLPPIAPARSPRRGRVAEAAPANRDDSDLTPPGFVVAECGLWSGQVWAAVLTELERHEAVGRADFEAWLRSTLLLGRAGDGGPGAPLVVGVPHALAQRRVSSRYQSIIAGALSRVAGAPLDIEIVVARAWLAQHPPSAPPADDDEAHGAVGA
ncbi:MAG: hypothetical protein M3464_14295, partial [Chloroflexota bacterium]|nr:hypothetical protein [Chloroflexota bacterium]